MPAASALLVAASIGSACLLTLSEASSGLLLAKVPLQADHAFALRYTHSVTLRPVESRYVVRGTQIVQTAEIFDEHGPGMAAVPGPGEQLAIVHDAGGPHFVLTMDRPLQRFVVRLHDLPAFRLVAGARAIELGRWGASVVEIRADCEAETGSTP